MFKLPKNCAHSHASKVMPQILEARLQKFVNQELPDVHLDLEKAEEPEIMLPSMDHRQSNGIPEEHLLLLY